MQWIEQLFHVRPDNGDGTLEALILIVAIVLVVVVFPPLRRRFVSLVAGSIHRAPERP